MEICNRIYSHDHNLIAQCCYSINLNTFHLSFYIYLVTETGIGYLHKNLINEDKRLFGHILSSSIGELAINTETYQRYRQLSVELDFKNGITASGTALDIIHEASAILRQQWHKMPPIISFYVANPV